MRDTSDERYSNSRSDDSPNGGDPPHLDNRRHERRRMLGESGAVNLFGLAGLLGAIFLAAIGIFLAGTVENANAETVVWSGNGTNDGVCSDIGEFDDLDPGPGEQGWLFILTSPDPGPWTLTATFNPGGVEMASGVQQGNGSIHFVVYSPADATLVSASATNGSDLSVLTVSHCEVNEEEPENPTLIIYKVCPSDEDFTFSISPPETIPTPTIGCGENSGVINLEADQEYDVTEELPPGWVLANVTCTVVDETPIENGVSFTPGDGDAIECTFTNRLPDQENPTLIVYKECIGDADTDFSFTLDPDEDIPFSTFGCGENSGTIDLTVDTEYDLTEDMPLPDGWTLTDVTCTGIDYNEIDDGVSFTPVDSESIECTFTNTFEEEPDTPTLIVFKVCVGDVDADFTFDITPDEDMPFSTFGCGESSGTIELEADTEYDVTEVMPLDDGWNFAGATCAGINESTTDNGVSFTPVDSETISCTFTNVFEEAENPILIVFKDCIGGDGENFDFSLDGDGIVATPTLGCGENSGIINLEAESGYDLTEDMPLGDGWTLTGVSCTGVDEASITDGVNFTPDEDDVILCTFTNSFEEEVVITDVVPTPTEPTPPLPPAGVVETPGVAGTVEPTLVAEVSGVRIIPPSTGTGGLVGENGQVPWPYLIVALGTAALGLVTIFWARTQR